jgi:hypothetical protein
VLAALSALPALSGLLLAALMLSALSRFALAALLLLAGFLLAALLRIALLVLRVALWILLFVRHRDVLHGFWKPPVQRHDNPRTLIGVPRGFAHIFGNELENHGKMPPFAAAGAEQGSRGATSFPALPRGSRPVKTRRGSRFAGIREAADAWNISSSSSSTASRSVPSTA